VGDADVRDESLGEGVADGVEDARGRTDVDGGAVRVLVGAPVAVALRVGTAECDGVRDDDVDFDAPTERVPELFADGVAGADAEPLAVSAGARTASSASSASR
jgi:hypothetical protein